MVPAKWPRRTAVHWPAPARISAPSALARSESRRRRLATAGAPSASILRWGAVGDQQFAPLGPRGEPGTHRREAIVWRSPFELTWGTPHLWSAPLYDVVPAWVHRYTRGAGTWVHVVAAPSGHVASSSAAQMSRAYQGSLTDRGVSGRQLGPDLVLHRMPVRPRIPRCIWVSGSAST